MVRCSFRDDPSNVFMILDMDASNKDNNYSVGWAYGAHYWDIVVDYLNQNFASIALCGVENGEFNERFTKKSSHPTAAERTQKVKEDLQMIGIENVIELVDFVFLDASHPELTASQKYYAYRKAREVTGRYLCDSLTEMQKLFYHCDYQYNLTIRPGYNINNSITKRVQAVADSVLENVSDSYDKDLGIDIYTAICGTLSEYKEEFRVSNTYSFARLRDAVVFLLFRMIEKNCTLKKCPNCGEYFVPENRSDTVYCHMSSPQMPLKSCQEYTRYAKFLKKTQENEAVKTYRQIYNTAMNRIRRIRANSGECSELNAWLNEFMNVARQWKADVKAGTKTEVEYIEWLKSVKEKKVL